MTYLLEIPLVRSGGGLQVSWMGVFGNKIGRDRSRKLKRQCVQELEEVLLPWLDYGTRWVANLAVQQIWKHILNAGTAGTRILHEPETSNSLRQFGLNHKDRSQLEDPEVVCDCKLEERAAGSKARGVRVRVDDGRLVETIRYILDVTIPADTSQDGVLTGIKLQVREVSIGLRSLRT
ncbi:hypothetical protein C8R44DRAFT_858108 [Mycena epipterygia]|nr:hypothetical protein C8R44DRAFT_858108 [Mycena epipterygia]